MRSPLWFHLLADVLRTELVAPQAQEGAAYGVTTSAMAGVSAYANLTALFEQMRIPRYERIAITPSIVHVHPYEMIKIRQLL